MQIKIHKMQEQLNPLHMFTGRWLYYYYPKSRTKWFGINNGNGPFSTLVYVCHIIGGSVISICNILTLFHLDKKRGHIGMWLIWSQLNYMHVRGMYWVMFLRQSAQHNFPRVIPLVFSRGEGSGCRGVWGYCRCHYVDMSWYRLLLPLVAGCLHPSPAPGALPNGRGQCSPHH